MIIAKIYRQDMLKVIDENNIDFSFDEENTRELWLAIVGPIVAMRTI